MPSLTNYPNVRPSLYLDFSNSRQVDPRIEFTRATTATRTNSKGIIEVVPANVPRIDYDPVTGECLGLLVEEVRTNLFVNSVFAGATAGTPGTAPTSWGLNAAGGSLSLPGGSAHAGSNRVQFSATSNRQFIVQNTNVTAGQILSLSIALEVISGAIPINNIHLAFGASATTARYFLDGVEVSSAVQPTVGKHKLLVLLTATATGNLETRLGMGVLGNGTGSVILDIPQLEAGAFPTSYIPTTTAAVTRAAELPQMSGSNFSDWYSPTGGTMVAEYSLIGTPAAGAAFAIDNGSVSERLVVFADNAGSAGAQPGFSVTASGATQVNIAFGTVAEFQRNTVAAAYGLNDFAAALNGVLGTDIAGTLPLVDRAKFGHSSAGQYMCGHIRRIAYYPTRLPNAQLQALTAS